LFALNPFREGASFRDRESQATEAKSPTFPKSPTLYKILDLFTYFMMPFLLRQNGGFIPACQEHRLLELWG
jgi:hypothetical protein